jgi:hypothetical protein
VDGYYVFPDSGADAGPGDAEVRPEDWVSRLGGAGDEGATAIAAVPNGDIVLAGSFRRT